MVAFEFEQFDLLLKSPSTVESWALDNAPDVLKRKLQLPEEEDLLEPGQIVLIVEPLSRVTARGRTQQPDLVVILQRANAHARELAHLMYGPHVLLPSYAASA